MQMMVSNIALGKIHCSVEEEKLELKKKKKKSAAAEIH